MISDKFQKALDALTATVDSKKPEEAELFNIVSIGMQEGLSHDFIIQSVANAYDQCKIPEKGNKTLGDMNILECLKMIQDGGFPHEKRLADVIFTDTMKRFNKCTEEERKQAMQFTGTETVEHFVYLIRKTIELKIGYLPG